MCLGFQLLYHVEWNIVTNLLPYKLYNKIKDERFLLSCVIYNRESLFDILKNSSAFVFALEMRAVKLSRFSLFTLYPPSWGEPTHVCAPFSGPSNRKGWSYLPSFSHTLPLLLGSPDLQILLSSKFLMHIRH